MRPWCWTRWVALLAVLWVWVGSAFGQPLQWAGNTKQFLTNIGQIPSRGAVAEPWQSLSITTQTYPITSGQAVYCVVTTNNWATTTSYLMNFDFNVGNNSQWWVVLGPYASGTPVQYYIRAEGQSASVVYDNNGAQNFSFYTRFSPTFRNSAILQWFETDYKTILKRLPEVVKMGYGAIYLPSPTKSGGGGFSVGYNPVDRFDLGDRLNLGTVRTKYGTTQELWELIRVAKRLGLEIYFDAVLNHNDNRASTAINRYPDMIPEDFHIRSSADTGNSEVDFNSAGAFANTTLNHDLVGLADIAHEDGNNTQTGAFSLPSYAGFNIFGKPNFIRHPQVPAYYPNGVPVAEDARELLKRWGWWMVTGLGADGFRLDAVRHVTPQFFDRAIDQPGSQVSNGDWIPYLYGLNSSLYIFGEDYSSDSWELREYVKTGMNMLDFPLKFTLDNIFNSGGFGDLGAAISNGYALNVSTGLGYEFGGLGRNFGTAFVQSHDQGPPTSNNLAYAFALTRPGRAKVYYDGNNIEPNDWGHFPKPGRFDSLGAGDDLLRPMLDARLRFGRGELVQRYVGTNFYAYERSVNGGAILLVALNSRGDMEQTKSFNTGFSNGTILRDLSGQKPDVTVGLDGAVTVTVPANSTATNQNNSTGYVLYAPIAPESLPGVSPVRLFLVDATLSKAAEILPTTIATPGGTYSGADGYQAHVVSKNRLHLAVTTDSSGYSAFVKVDQGVSLNNISLNSNSPEGLTDGFMPMTKLSNGNFELSNLDVSGLEDGVHVFRVRVFKNTGSSPGIFSEFPTFIQIQRSKNWTVTGDLGKYGTALVNQARSPSSNNNRLDQMFVTNDDKYLYVGLAGNVDTSESLTNGVAMFFDSDGNGNTGVRDFSLISDDTGPATRLLSNARITGPSGFGADFGMGVLRRSQIGTSPDLSTIGDVVTPPAFGAFAGFYRIDTNALSRLIRNPVAVAWKPRNGPFENPPKGLEAAIPLRSLYPGTITSGQSLKLVAYLCTTGESGSVLPASNSLRGTLGGYGEAISWVTNQFLPAQTFPNNNADPGNAAFTATSAANYVLKFSSGPSRNLRLTAEAPIYVSALGIWRQAVTLQNVGGIAINGPIYVIATLPSGVDLVDKAENSLTVSGGQYREVELRDGNLKPRAMVRIELQYRAGSGANLNPSLQTRVGRGVL